MNPNQYSPNDRRLNVIKAERAISKTAAVASEAIKPSFSPIWYGELANMNLPIPTWIVDQLIPDASITIISAPPAHFKTWLALDIAIRVASGKPVFGRFKTKQTKVLIVDEESGLARARERLQKLGVSIDTPIAVTRASNFKLDETSAKSLITYCKSQSIGFVIFDSLTRIHMGDENSAKDMSMIMGELKRLAQAGIAVFLIHHNRKPQQFGGGGANEMRGSGDILAACDVQMSLKRKPGSNVITITQNKNRDAPDIVPFDLAITGNENSLTFEYIGSAPKQVDKAERTDSAVLELLVDGESLFQEQIIAALKSVDGVGGEQMISRRLKALLEAGSLTCTTGAKGKHLYRLQLGHGDE